jgi:Putative F0F1-ATPase subunit Ca2+/Mg2+ transporter
MRRTTRADENKTPALPGYCNSLHHWTKETLPATSPKGVVCRRSFCTPSKAGGPAGHGTLEAAMAKNFMVQVGEYTSLAFLLPAATFVGYVIGYLLDKVFHTHFLYLVFLILGIIAGFVQLIRQIQRDTGGNGS